MLNKFVVFIVLLTFGFILTPGTYWHDCEKIHTSHKNDVPEQAHFEKGDCFVCDFQLFPVENQVQTSIHFAPECYSPAFCLPKGISLLKSEHCFLRGPPNRVRVRVSARVSARVRVRVGSGLPLNRDSLLNFLAFDSRQVESEIRIET